MFNAFDPQGARDGRESDRAPERAPEQPMADREVPIGFAVTPAGVHEWLDGELSEAEIRRADTARHVEFWNRLNSDVEVRRQMKTPAHVSAQIMAAIAPTQVAAPATESWMSRGVTLSPMVAVAAAAGLLAAGALIASIVR
jgi:hypothetical protein